MLEGLVTWILNNYLGKYIENLNTDQLSIALLSGEVELENLPLRKNAFYNLGLPIRVRSGFVGKIKLQIPLRQIRSAPWVIVIERLYLVAAPINLSEWNAEVEESILQECKLSLLDALEAQWRADTETTPDGGYYASSFSSWMNYGTGLATNIIENLQLKIKDVHLRYEDRITCGDGNAFACGLIMDSFSAESCDTNWQRSFTNFSQNQYAGCSFKLLELQNMALYWDRLPPESDNLVDLPLADLAVQMQNLLKTEHHQFILSPVSAVAHLKRERCEQPLRSRSHPRFTCQLSLEEVSIILSDKQYNQMIGCFHGLTTIDKIRIFRQKRPAEAVSKNAKAWWSYAVKCYFSDSFFMDPKPSWESCLSQARECIKYVDLYTMLLKTPTMTLSPEMKLFKDKVEWTTPFEQLKLLRESAMRRVPRKQNNPSQTDAVMDYDRAQGRSMLMQWFPQWWGWYGSAADPPDLSPRRSNPDFTPDLEGEILDVIADSIENNTLLKRDAVFGLFEFLLPKGSFQICSEKNDMKINTVLKLDFENVGFSVITRPRTSSHTLSVTLGSICLKDHLTENSLFPILISSQGKIREGLCNLRFSSVPPFVMKPILSNTNIAQMASPNDSLFQLIYERKPINMNCDYRLHVKSQSLEIVYNPLAVKWLVDFLTFPFSISNEKLTNLPERTNAAYSHVKNTTKMHLISQWENILQGDLTERSIWNLELDISAPQFFVIENFSDRNGLVAVLDFGKLHVSNYNSEQVLEVDETEEDENEMFMTPCSTPPASEVSDFNLTDCAASPIPPDTPQLQPNISLNQDALYQKLYYRYRVELSDLQILVGKIKDNWKFTNLKGTSSLHIIDRFNILLRIERRVIYTSDPQFPSVTLCGSLPNLIVHINEHKLLYIQSLLAVLNVPSQNTKNDNSPAPINEDWKISPPIDEPTEELSDADVTERSSNQLSRLLMVQFSVDQLALEVQSRGRSIAEIQVCGVKAVFTKRIYDFNLSLSVHSFLLVDALQTYGPDFELLIASHKHVGMDSVSGSIKDSEPTSPVSPSSPPEYSSRPLHPPPPAALSQALNSLSIMDTSTHVCISPSGDAINIPVIGIMDSEALIVVELTVVSPNCPSSQNEEIIIANILFNNLDIIANQETIVELLGFVKRITSNSYSKPTAADKSAQLSPKCDSPKSADTSIDKISIRHEITFDFHRLSVLLLRGSLEEGAIFGKKIATATMSDAKIQATISENKMEMTGSLGGLQVVSLCPGTTVHQKILSVGHDPLINQNLSMPSDYISSLSQEIYKGIDDKSTHLKEEKAFSFKIIKSFDPGPGKENSLSDDLRVNVCLRMASVWYVHSGIFIGEVQSCVTEFKQYLSNLARSIKIAATDMAIGLVNPRSDSLSSSRLISGSTEWISPRRPRSISIGFQEYEDVESSGTNIILNLDVLLETPVVVLPRSPVSCEVFVAHLGNISINNKSGSTQEFNIKVRDINIYSLDVSSRLNTSVGVGDTSVESIYECGTYGKPVLHDTTIHFDIEQSDLSNDPSCEHLLQINGRVVTPLKISSTRQQYEQLLESIGSLSISTPSQHSSEQASSFNTDSTGIVTLNMDPQMRAQIINTFASASAPSQSSQHLRVNFQMPIFTIDLRGDFGKGEQSLVNLSFRDYLVKYEKCHSHVTNVEMSLRSITMEDLGDVDGKYRFMMSSHKLFTPKSDFVSHSNPDLTNCGASNTNLEILSLNTERRNSLPHKFHSNIFHINENIQLKKTKVKRSTFSLHEDNLVLISIQIVSPDHPFFAEKYNNVRKRTNINFNCLDLIMSIDSWVVVLDFFGIGSDSHSSNDDKSLSVRDDAKQNRTIDSGDTEMDVSIQSLNVILLRPQYEVCRANISRLQVLMKDKNKDGNDGGRQITGTLGSMSLIDLSPYGNIWKERFLSCGKEALNFQYDRFATNDPVRAHYDTKLSIEMSSIVFIHTKRFVGEIQAYFRDFSQLQSVLSQARQKVSVTANSKFTRMKIFIKCLSPAILIPVCSTNSSLLVAEIGKLTVDNEFKLAGSKGTISSIRDAESDVRELLDVMTIHLENMNLYCGKKISDLSSFTTGAMKKKLKHMNCNEYGPTTVINRKGPFLLTEKCDLTLQVEKNLEHIHNVADMSIQGTLNTLNGSIDLQQYKVIKGLLSHNLGENIDDLALSPNIPSYTMNSEEKIWTLTSIQFDLLNVTLRLQNEHNVSSLACINFIKSRLLVESFSDMTQDIDLVSQEILLSDIRYESDPVNKRSNVFSNIVIPMGLKMGDKNQHSVQAEIHARKRKEHSAYTILVNSMRLMAIIDWWQAVNEFIMSPAIGEDVKPPNSKQLSTLYNELENLTSPRQSPTNESPFDLKVNITDSQIVFVEDTSQWDTNAVILKSTIVITYKPGGEPKPLSCVLNHCEVFSCVLGMEEETALSIIDPVTLQIDVTSGRMLKIQSPQLSIRLSYHDVCMLIKMFQSLPQQTMGAKQLANSSSSLPVNKNRESVQKLRELGFMSIDCEQALAQFDGNLEQAAYWLTENAKMTHIHSTTSHNDTQSFDMFQVKADCISICIIDDCRDSDVPLLELSLSEMILLQDMRFNSRTAHDSPPLCLSPEAEPTVNRESGPGGGRLQCKLASDYYNRALSGWEPFIERWSCDASWEYGLMNSLHQKRLQLELNSTELLNINITSTLIELFNVVKDNWTQDFYSLPNRSESSPKLSPPGYRRRSPFIPFALRNLSGCKLWFTTIVTTADIISENIELSEPDESWIEVSTEDVVPFKFGERGKRRHRDSHKLRLHQLGVRIDGWNSISPVCVDKVGVFFRHITHTESDVEARLVFAITLEGSARKLITVRSALQLVNNLPITIEVRADNITSKAAGSMWSTISPPKPVYVKSDDTWCVPLSHNPTPMWVRPLVSHHSVSSPTSIPSYLYCAQPIDWRLATRQAPEDCLQIPHVCHSNTQASYRFCCILRRETFPMERGIPQPGHTMILKSPVRIVNLLPVELSFKVGPYDHEVNRISPGQTAPLSQVDVQKPIEISVYLEGFPGVALLTISPTVTESFSSRLKLSDTSGRKLTLNAYVSIKRSDTIKVSISAPYWIINRTGVPIVFRQEGVPTETAGQFEEHEIARMVAPLLFSFTDCDGSSTVVARVGSGVIQNGNPLWCSPFGLSPGIMVRRLIVSNISAISGNERILLVGIAIRPGRGRYRYTNICTISPRFQIHNNTSFHLQFAQKCYATTIVDPGANSTYINTTPKCSIPFHWPNHDQELLLCVKIMNIPNCNWSGGFQIDTNHSLHVNIRDSNAISYFLRLEVILQGATYFIVFTDADTMPPPIRLDNYSFVHLHFHQIGCKEESLIKAHSTKPWALVEPCGTAILAIRAPGGTRTTINLQKLDEAKPLTYQNFIYVAFTGTHLGNNSRSNGIENTQLVLEVSSGPSSSGVVFLAKKRDGERAQLWRLNKDGHLLHEGSSPPQPANAPPNVNAPHALVLDIEGSAPQPSTMVGLCVRRVHPRRSSTQTWRFTADGQLRCAHNNMIVQPLDGFFGLREGNRAVLGLPGPPGPHFLNNGLPIEHAVSSQTLRPGSGSLEVSVTTDGPTRVIRIIDVKQRSDSLENNITEIKELDMNTIETQLRVAVGGVGLSLVSRSPSQELVFCLFSGVLLESVWSSLSQKLNLSVQDVQIDNQLLGTLCPVLLHTIKNRNGSYDGQGTSHPAAIHLSAERATLPPTTRYNAHIFKHFIISLRPISIHFEERLLLKLCLWMGIGVSEDSFNEEADETDFETQKILTEITAVHAKRYYFGVLKLIPNQIRLSMHTVSKLPPTLAAIKKRLGLKLIKFEDAGVELEPFIRWHPFETSQFLWHSIVKHYKDELKWQAAVILGSVDFLGNPLGFVQDVSDGVSGLIYEGSVGALVKNVAHGISNSAAKVSESLGDGIGRVILDEAHEETRARIRGIGESGGTNHLVAGLRGLGLGLLGGVTSLVKHTYEGAAHQGIPGFFTGVGRGLIGTVTKPVVGVLDLAAETAAAVRDTSRRSDRWIPERSRPPRCPMGPGGLLPRFSYTQSIGHQFLYSINGRDYEEGFLAYDVIRGEPSDIRALITTRYFRVFTCESGEPAIVIETHLSNLIGCQAVTDDLDESYIELTRKVDSAGVPGVRRPRVQCDTPDLARWVSHQVNYAKCMFHEKLFTLQSVDTD